MPDTNGVMVIVPALCVWYTDNYWVVSKKESYPKWIDTNVWCVADGTRMGISVWYPPLLLPPHSHPMLYRRREASPPPSRAVSSR